MSSDHTTVGSAQHASDAMRDLAALTEHLGGHPSDATWTTGSLLAITSRLAKTLHQIAEAHKANYAAAHAAFTGSGAKGKVLALNAATEFEQASRALAGVYRHLDQAAYLSNQIDWDETTPVSPAPSATHVPARRLPAMKRADIGFTR
ncbi:hypothetical protein Xcel_0806 [Xylanimonas cellulosilytica DSM 15894]|uniref:Uncharacterized protein n=1 Tax=Xylanimonas cellulosilytica (strain DSM 15894 / JCM 12276 / CECT 5975 / KCTC 9989 / LMG 20990 / NBRC 107835 / XIL07) TaxID=446471 RepID=D1BY01_XYLCX|nr:hypothetical protein [Xylanimonas cellulosilytica]ACZ29844.1 hypothetical protein Xcel_0806 [Xylanimonas cellulosilytica DSM 15894]